MLIAQRIVTFQELFVGLMSTNSRLFKEELVKAFLDKYPSLKTDWNTILETLDNQYPIGWTFAAAQWRSDDDQIMTFQTITEVINFLYTWKDTHPLTQVSISKAEVKLGKMLGLFIEPIVNRTLRLGIGKSLLGTTNKSPMLAKKYEGQNLRREVAVTEKLNGNRCIAYYENGKWNFVSRNNKPMKVDFDMSNMPINYIYDGEVLSVTQTNQVKLRAHNISQGIHVTSPSTVSLFSATSGLINRSSANKQLVYNIFDIIENEKYIERRNFLNTLTKSTSANVEILPLLYYGNDTLHVQKLLDVISKSGGEGLMLNDPSRMYEHTRTDALLKYKHIYYIDMVVKDTYMGKGKYEGQVGGLIAEIKTENNKIVQCEVGTGLSDFERLHWALHPNDIIGKIIEVGYQDMTQNQKVIGTNNWSLQFPRLISVRRDKDETSEF